MNNTHKKYRLATLEDSARILSLMARHSRKVGRVYDIDWDPKSALETIESTIRSGIVLVGDTCYAAAFITAFPWNKQEQVATVFFWFFSHPRDIKIFDELVAECKRRGATRICASGFHPANAIGRFYAKRNLHPWEVHHIGET